MMNIPSVERSNILNKERKRKTVFTTEEDEIIFDFVDKFGSRRWERIESIIQTRTSRQCRERWNNFLSPTIVKKEWSFEEDRLLENLVSQYGKKWSKFVEYFPGRTNILIKNRFSLLMRHTKTGKRIQNQILNEKINITSIHIDVVGEVDFSDKTENITSVDEQLFNSSSENPAETDDIFSFDNFFWSFE
jgi:hypothetical protein